MAKKKTIEEGFIEMEEAVKAELEDDYADFTDTYASDEETEPAEEQYEAVAEEVEPPPVPEPEAAFVAEPEPAAFVEPEKPDFKGNQKRQPLSEVSSSSITALQPQGRVMTAQDLKMRRMKREKSSNLRRYM